MILPFDFSVFPLSHIMPNPSTPSPPHSKGTPICSILSETTPLKRDLSGSQSHPKPPEPKDSNSYRDMARDECEIFVGPMPVDEFLLEFVPKAPEVRPANQIMFSPCTVLQNEKDFVSHPALKVVSMFMTITDPRNHGIRPLSQARTCQYYHSPG